MAGEDLRTWHPGQADGVVCGSSEPGLRAHDSNNSVSQGGFPWKSQVLHSPLTSPLWALSSLEPHHQDFNELGSWW